MQKFFLLTRGRTGSTAVLDALNKIPEISTVQEPFLPSSDNWTLRLGNDILPYYDQYVQDIPLFQRVIARGRCMSNYLNLLESTAEKANSAAFGFKILSHHLKDHPKISRQLDNRHYRCIYLRRDLFFQVISGMVAARTGRYNSNKEVGNCERIYLDPIYFEDLLNAELLEAEKDKITVAQWRYDTLPVYYEDFVKRPSQFFENICYFLKVSVSVTPQTSYKKMIGNVRQEVENFYELQQIAEKYRDDAGRYDIKRT